MTKEDETIVVMTWSYVEAATPPHDYESDSADTDGFDIAHAYATQGCPFAGTFSASIDCCIWIM